MSTQFSADVESTATSKSSTFAPGIQIELRLLTLIIAVSGLANAYFYEPAAEIFLWHAAVPELLLLLFCHLQGRCYNARVVRWLDLWITFCLIVAAANSNTYDHPPFSGLDQWAFMITASVVNSYISYVAIHKPFRDPRCLIRQLTSSSPPDPAILLDDAPPKPPFAPGLQIEPRILTLICSIVTAFFSSNYLGRSSVVTPTTAFSLALLIAGHCIRGCYEPLLWASLDLLVFVSCLAAHLLVWSDFPYSSGSPALVRRMIGLVVSGIALLLALVIFVVSNRAVFRPYADERMGLKQLFRRRRIQLEEANEQGQPVA